MAEIWISGIVLIGLFYFFLVLPQQLSNRKHRKELTQIQVGDSVVTIGGLIGEIVELDTSQVILQIAPNVTIRVMRSAISNRLRASTEKK